jgi:hypothetical protein
VGNFDGQVRSVFAQLARTLEEVGAKLSDMVTMGPARAQTALRCRLGPLAVV